MLASIPSRDYPRNCSCSLEEAVTAAELDAIVERLRQRIGTETPRTITEVEKGAIRRFADAIGDSNPLYRDEQYARRTRFGGIIAPPTFVAAFTAGHFPEIVDSTLPFERMLHSEDTCTCWRSLRPGDVITAFARYAGAFSRQGSRGPMVFQQADLILQDLSAQRVAEVRITTVSF